MQRIFNESLLPGRRDRAMRLGFPDAAGFLMREVADGIAARAGDVARAFPRAVIAGTGAGLVGAALARPDRRILQADPSPAMAAEAARRVPGAKTMEMPAGLLDFPPGEADLAVSALLMHALNDPVGHLIQLAWALKPDGLLIAALFGGQTLAELRAALAEAEAEILGGLGPRVAPMGEIRDLGALLQRAGLAMPVADSDRLEVHYPSALELMRDLRAMGETSTLVAEPRRALRRDVLARAIELYARHFPAPEGRVRATFEIVYLTGWTPGPDQPQPLRPGSATTRLADALGTVEHPAGEKAKPNK